MTNDYKEWMGRLILKRAMRKRKLEDMICYQCHKLNHCLDVCEAIDKEQFVVSCSNYERRYE